MSKETKQRVANAFRAMRNIGISEDKVKPALKNLLKLFDKNWGLIEEENYRALADAIFEREEAEAAEHAVKVVNNEATEHSKKNVNSEEENYLEEEAQATEEPERPLKRLRLRYREGSTPSMNMSNSSVPRTPLIKPKEEPDALPETRPLNLKQSQGMVESTHPNAGNTRVKSQAAQECSSILEIASSFLGEVKMSLSCHLVLGRHDFHTPSLEAVLKSVEEKCLRSYKTLDPNFSVMNLMQEMCECCLKLGTESTNESPETIDVTPAIDLLKKTSATNALGAKGLCFSSSNGLVDSLFDAQVILPQTLLLPPSCDSFGDGSQPNRMGWGEDRRTNIENQENGVEDTNSLSLVVVEQCELIPEKIRSLHDVIDISKGQEKVVITLVNEVNNECPSFYYIPQNAVFQNACVNFALSRIGDNNCCSTCFGDCLSLSTPCACGHENGGAFAYTSDGLVKEDFLKECISMNRDQKKHCKFFCKECPLEKSKNEDIIEPCKGHLLRTFIKECWWKCGCNKQCGNRVVQRGIRCNLQVFMTTSEGKGWGLRTLEDLPKGAFVCEYVGEVLTNSELFDRVSRSSEGKNHSYPVLLDADWGSKGALKNEEALCLDATYYGNVARFINHRCYDSNLVEIPVEVETPDHHYYHLAFFTTRKVNAMEELTWDYGIDFDDNDHPIKAFSCLCGSEFCRNIKRFTSSVLSRSASRR